MEHDFWLERWQRHDIGFHQPQGHDQLRRLWPSLSLPQASTIFVPLCGKSRDMAWLARQGHTIIGAELSDIAIREFFDDEQIAPLVSNDGSFEVFAGGPYKLLSGDVFKLDAAHLADVAAVYDRAALIALPPDMRRAYAEHLTATLPRMAPIFVISIEYLAEQIAGPPFSVSPAEVRSLFGESYEIEVLESRDGLAASDNLKKRGVTKLEETAYLLRRRA